MAVPTVIDAGLRLFGLASFNHSFRFVGFNDILTLRSQIAVRESSKNGVPSFVKELKSRVQFILGGLQRVAGSVPWKIHRSGRSENIAALPQKVCQ
jgi:hypothetical protein